MPCGPAVLPVKAKDDRDRVALFLPSLRGGGAERSTLNLAMGLHSAGLSVDLVLVRAEGPYLEAVPEGIRVVDLRSGRALFSLAGFTRYLRRVRPAAVLSAMGHINLVALWAKWLSGGSTRVVVSVRNTNPQDRSGVKAGRPARAHIIKLLTRWFYTSADGIVAVSEGVALDLVRTIGIPHRKITVIYNPVVTSDLHAKASEFLTHPWFAPGEPPVVLAVGRLVVQKDFLTLLRAFALVRREIPARLIILGEGPERSRLESLIRQLRLVDDVSLPGFDVNPFRYMARARLFVLSSMHEGLPGALIQAMACGCPVVSTDCPGGPREILEGGRYGRLAPVGDPSALAAAIHLTLKEPRQPVPPIALQPFDSDHVANAYLALLGLAAPSGQAPAISPPRLLRQKTS